MTEILLSIVIWGGVFAAERAAQRRGVLTGYEMVSSANAIIVGAVGLLGIWRIINGTGINSAFYSNMINIVIGYFILDMIKIVGERNYIFILHHVIALLLMYNGIMHCIPVLDVIVMLTELSTPFLHYMTWSRSQPSTVKNSNKKAIATGLFILLFIITRCLLLPLAVYAYWTSLGWTKLPYIALVSVNMYWLTRIIRMILRATWSK